MTSEKSQKSKLMKEKNQGKLKEKPVLEDYTSFREQRNLFFFQYAYLFKINI